MTYKYDEQNGNLISNKLYHVNDAIASGIHTADIDDQLGFTTTNITTTNNYTYDAIGNLKQDKTEEILEIKWTVSGKIKKIIRTGISTKPDLEYVYDAMGNRIAKILKPDGSSFENGGTDNPTQWTYTYYVRDAQGNIMANYQKSTSNSITSFKLIERSIYGSSRLGIDKTTIDLTASTTPPTILNHNLGLKNYELSNHLGNVATVISDRKIPRSVLGANIDFYMPDIVSATDYYPFGMTMQERTFSAGVEAYRFGFNGKENDAEISEKVEWQDYGMRFFNTLIVRFARVDPITSHYAWFSPYIFAGNNPIMFVDLDGGEEKKPEPPKQNIMIIIPSSSELEQKYYDKVGGDQGTWFVIVANDMVSAEKQLNIYSNNTDVSNVVIITHGALVDGTIMLSNEMGLFNSATFVNYNTQKTKRDDIKAQISALNKISGLVEPGGNLVIAACLTGNGEKGVKLTRSMKESLTASVNLFVSKGVVTGPDVDINSYSRKLKAYTDLQFEVPLINFNLFARDADQNFHKNNVGEGFLFIQSNSNKIVDLSQTSGFTGNIVLHESGATPIELTKKIPITNNKK